ncbi:MAG: fructosamine kinase family protein [Bdellovibrio sp.]|nr:fructosamine kinase family protein [Bdellovibrio sp.]
MISREQWLKGLADHLRQLEMLWDLEPIQLMDNLSVHIVGHSKRKSDGLAVVVKTGPDIDLIDREKQWLRHFPGYAVQVLGAEKSHGAILMERLEPGVTLKQATEHDDDEKTLILASMIKGLHSRSIIGGVFKHLSELAKDLDVLEGAVDKKLLAKARGIFAELTLDRSQDRLLHGDLHHGNILKHKVSWKVIDPHGYLGDPTFEMAVMMYNPLDAFPTNRPLKKTLERRFAILNEQLYFDLQRMKMWAFAMAMLSTAWTFEDTQKLLGIPFLVAQELQ